MRHFVQSQGLYARPGLVIQTMELRKERLFVFDIPNGFGLRHRVPYRML